MEKLVKNHHRLFNLKAAGCLVQPVRSFYKIPKNGKMNTMTFRYSDVPKVKKNFVPSGLDEQTQFKNELFVTERNRIASKLVPRIEKIKVEYETPAIGNSATMFMNKNLSTPRDCAMHISRTVADQMVLAKVTKNVENTQSEGLVLQNEDGTTTAISNASDSDDNQATYWDVHSVLPYDCKIEFLKFQMKASAEDFHQVNKAYWRSCAMVLGATLTKAFKDNQSLGLLKVPEVSVESGAFCYDIELDESLTDWNPTEENLLYITKVARSIISTNANFERLQVDTDFAKELFQDDKSRLSRLNHHNPTVPVSLYRLGHFIEMMDGPLISDTSHFYHYVVTALHRLNDQPLFRRVQGISLPEKLKVHHTVWNMLENRSRKLVTEQLPGKSVFKKNEELNLFKHKSIEDQTKIYSKATGQWKPDAFKSENRPLQNI